jgi:hypothetical protein
MNPPSRATLIFLLAIVGVLAHSQEAAEPFSKIESHSLQVENDPVYGTSTDPSRSAFSMPGLDSMRAVHPTNPRNIPKSILDRRYLLLNGVQLGMALFDVEMTQHCIAQHTCREGNPIMPSSQAGQISVNLGLAVDIAAGSYWMKKHNMKFWWIAPAAGIGAHSAGVATGIAHR